MKYLILILMVPFFILEGNTCGQAIAGIYNDTPTPAETALHDAPYRILLQEIQTKLCDKDWKIEVNNPNPGFADPFLMIEYPDENVIERGTTVHYFEPVSRGLSCTVSLKASSPLNQSLLDSQRQQTEICNEQDTLSNRLIAKYIRNDEKFTAADSAVIDKISATVNKVNRAFARLRNERRLATISLQLNSSGTEDEENDINAGTAKRLPPVDGVAYSILFAQKLHEDDVNSPDTLYKAVLYIGDWPAQPDLMKGNLFHFAHFDKHPWTDKQHSGKPFLENMKVVIRGGYYNRIMKVVRSIDWTRLEALINSCGGTCSFVANSNK